MPAIAQEAKPEIVKETTEKAPKLSARKMAKQTAESVSKLDQNQQKMILNYTRNLAKVDVKKEMKKTMKKLSPEDRQKVLDYMVKVQSPKMQKPVAAVKDVKARVPNKANVKTSKPTPKTDKPKFVMKDKSVDPSTITAIEIMDKTYDFGTIKQGEKASTVYRVKNIGKNPLIISKAKGSCGCTVPKWPKEAIAPGEIAEIKVVFNSTRKKGKQNKRITLTANTEPAQSHMTITGMVEVPAPAPAEKQ